MFKSIIVVLLLLLLYTATVLSQAPRLLSHNGFLADNVGQPINGKVGMVFNLYTTSVGGVSLWSQSFTDPADSVVVSNGVYNVTLDLSTAPSLTYNTQYYLEISVNGETITPRLKLTSAPYSLGPWNTSSNKVYYTGGYVGIGTNNPTNNLVISEDANSFIGLTISNTNTGASSAEEISFANEDGSQAFIRIYDNDNATYPGRMLISNNRTGGSIHFGTAGINSRMVIANDGNVGIGTTSPIAPLHITPNSSSYAFRIDQGVNGHGILSYVNTTSSAQTVLAAASNVSGGFYVKGDGNVGIGTSSPYTKLTLTDAIGFTNSTNPMVYIYQSGTSNAERPVIAHSPSFPTWGLSYQDVGDKMMFQAGGNPVMAVNLGSSQVELFKADGTKTIELDPEEGTGRGADISLWNDAGVNTIQIDADYANTGVGRIVTDVLQIQGGSDLSEHFEVNNSGLEVQPVPGMVVCIDSKEPGKLIVSNKSYDPRVAGVISGAGGITTGMLMGQAGSIADGHYPIALTGRVYCLADASSSPIEPGDLLTSSDIPGHAMKAHDYTKAQGAIIGKAMSSLKEGRGLVLILVNLQ
ncbi:MAG: hypothetical protein HY707_01580 [Ignavibacteriae bacterium]|nr:hypothetical protein [Ignavibacteriota bacterium]